MLGLIQMPPRLGCVRCPMCPDECFLLMSGNALHSFSTPFPLLFFRIGWVKMWKHKPLMPFDAKKHHNALCSKCCQVAAGEESQQDLMLCLSIPLNLSLPSFILRKGLLEYHDPSFTVALLKALQTIRGVAPQLLCCDWSVCNPCAIRVF